MATKSLAARSIPEQNALRLKRAILALQQLQRTNPPKSAIAKVAGKAMAILLNHTPEVSTLNAQNAPPGAAQDQPYHRAEEKVHAN